MNYLLGVDLGTSGVKTVLFDEKGIPISSATAEYPMFQPRNGWAEQNPIDWWAGVERTIKDVVENSAIEPDSIAGIGVAGQMHGLVMLDKAGEVIRPAILWCDGRTSGECREITERIGHSRLIEITANPALTGFTAGKMLWVKKHEPEQWSSCAHILLPKDYIIYKLTGSYSTECSDASGTNLFDVPNRCWSDDILAELEIERSLLPQVYESSEVVGTVTREVALRTGLREGTAVVAGAGDNAAAAIGVGVVNDGDAFVTIGTSGVIFAHTNEVRGDPEGRVHTFCAAVPGGWVTMSCTLAAGLSLKWLRDIFFAQEMQAAAGLGEDPYALMDRQAERVPIGANGLIYLPYLMGERSPVLDEKSRGVFFGLSASHNKYDMLRAVMEGVVFSQRECYDIMRQMNVIPTELLACGGGGKSRVWRQMLADVLNCPVNTVRNDKGPAFGVALLAGAGSGVFSDLAKTCKEFIKRDESQAPRRSASAEYHRSYEVYKTLYPSLKKSFLLLDSARRDRTGS